MVEFTKYKWIMLTLSLLVIVGSAGVTIAKGGFNLGIDFEAGLTQRIAVNSSEASIETIRTALAGMEGTQVQTMGGENEFQIRVKDSGESDFEAETKYAVKSMLESAFGADTVEVRGEEYVGPRFSEDLTGNTFWLILLTLSVILVYVWFRFQFAYALSSIAAIVHDMAVMLGIIGAFGLEVSTATIAAILTIIGYSLNDTIVIFDRVRENESLMSDSDLVTVVNTSITQSLGRTVITSLTTLLAVLAIYLFASGSIQQFALALIIGVVVGTYSSIFVASPVFLGIRARKKG